MASTGYGGNTFLDSGLSERYPYIRIDTNILELTGDSTRMQEFFTQLANNTRDSGRGINIYHFGGSHIQADVYPNRLRRNLELWSANAPEARGWVFPYSMVGTNNPTNYKVHYTGRWKGVRSPVKKDSMYTLGLMGISATTGDSIATIKMYSNEKNPPFAARRIRVYCNAGATAYSVGWQDDLFMPEVTNSPSEGYVEFRFKEPIDTVNLYLERNSSDTTQRFTLYGILLMNDAAALSYHSIGINGAGFTSYLRCQEFEKQIRQVPPDLAIISIGTNDANDLGFTPKDYADNYIRFVDMLRRANPDCAFIFTVPNDNYYRYRYPQKNIAKCEAVIYGLAGKYGAAVWNFYRIMGGYGSSQKWYRSHLMQRDRIHFTREGYEIKGDLISDAFLKLYQACLKTGTATGGGN